MNPERSDTYIELLRIARDEMNGEGIEYADFATRVNQAGIKQPHLELFHAIYGHKNSTPKTGSKYHMSFEAYMSLIEYEELAHSLEESKQARKEAKLATWIAIVAIVMQIIFGVADIFWGG